MNQEVIYLASASPRRKALLDQIGISHQICPMDVDESRIPQETALEYVSRLSLLKSTVAQGSLSLSANQIVLGADTTVVVDQEILGKPKDRVMGLAMLSTLSGRSHEVFTAVTVVKGDWNRTVSSVSRVFMRSTTDEERAAYWECGEPWDKAGGYGVQGKGAVFIQRIEGSYSGVMGLPLCETAQLLEQAGRRIF